MLITAATLLFISYRDLRDHLISNRSLIFLSLSLLHTFDLKIHLLQSLLVLLFLTLISHNFTLGGGDIKLISILVLFGNIEVSLTDYLAISTLIGSAHLALQFLRSRTLKGEIALAPTICAPMLVDLFVS